MTASLFFLMKQEVSHDSTLKLTDIKSQEWVIDGYDIRGYHSSHSHNLMTMFKLGRCLSLPGFHNIRTGCDSLSENT